ncbi:uncharacterized protein [Nothobranchius furzeri]|uniref:Myb/SANT-like DNA-binding domain-containing protein n=2 Tax=Nothobranchius TaxID=28779 RepID=A0A1A8AW20_NOTFU|nr:uncharacterized protein LOC107379858 isoform X2 [Nothobranchius furzeri]
MDFRGWNRDETQCLISIWAESSVQRKLMGSYRNRSVFEEIAGKMGDRSFSRSWRQCQRKIKQLKSLYRRAKKSQSNRDRTSCVCYEELDRVLGDKPSFHCGDECVMDLKQESTEEDEEALNSTVIVKVLEPDERNLCEGTNRTQPVSGSREFSSSVSDFWLKQVIQKPVHPQPLQRHQCHQHSPPPPPGSSHFPLVAHKPFTAGADWRACWRPSPVL